MYLSRSNSFPGERGSRVEGMPKFDLDELLSFEEVRLRAAHICELTRVGRPCVSRSCERRSPPLA